MPTVMRRILDDEVLDKTMKLFWHKGYFNVSIEDILKASGFNRAAIYKHFNSKNELFVSMLKRYREKITPQLTLPLQNSHRGLPAIEDFFTQFIWMHRDNQLQDGCLLISTAYDIPAHNQEVSELIHDFFNHLTQLFSAIFDTMKNSGTLSKTVDNQALADYLLSNLIGLLSLCRMRVSTSMIENQIKELMSKLKSLSDTQLN